MSIIGLAANVAAAVVVNGVVKADDNNAAYVPPSDGSVFTDYMVYSRYEHSLNRYQAGITSPNGFQGQSVAFFQLATDTVLWIADWTACKAGAIPNVPDPESPSSGDWVLLYEEPQTAMLTLTADGQKPLYRVSGTYVYGHKNPKMAKAVLMAQFPQPPWMKDGFTRTIPANVLTTDIIMGQAKQPYEFGRIKG